MREAVLTVGDEDLDDLGIGDLVSLCREAGLRDFEEFACYGDGAVIQVEVEERLDADRLDELAYVTRWKRVAESGDVHRYLVAFTTPVLPATVAERADDLVGTCDPAVDEEGATMSLVGPQEAIRDTLGEYESVGVSPELRHLGAYGGRQRPLDALTDRQREVVRTAYEMGYYEVPREAATADVAADLDLDPSTVAEHLQRAERNLLRRHLSSG